MVVNSDDQIQFAVSIVRNPHGPKWSTQRILAAPYSPVPVNDRRIVLWHAPRADRRVVALPAASGFVPSVVDGGGGRYTDGSDSQSAAPSSVDGIDPPATRSHR